MMKEDDPRSEAKITINELIWRFGNIKLTLGEADARAMEIVDMIFAEPKGNK